MPPPAMHIDTPPIDGNVYRIGRLKADVGSWISVLLAGKMRGERSKQPVKMSAKARKEAEASASTLSHDEAMYMTATFLVANLTREELADVQAICMGSVSRMMELAGSIVPLPVFDSGTWLIPEMEYDAPVVFELLKQSLAFNIAPFFPGPA